MKSRLKIMLSLASCIAMSVISCQREQLSDGQNPDIAPEGSLTTLVQQVEAVEASIEDIAAVQTGLNRYADELEGIMGRMEEDLVALGVKSVSSAEALAEVKAILDARSADFAAGAEALEAHATALKAGMSWKKGSLATLAQQKSLAAAAGILAEDIEAIVTDQSLPATEKELRDAYEKCVGSSLEALQAGICTWLGKPFAGYYPLAAASARMNTRIASLSRTLGVQMAGIESFEAEDHDAISASISENTSAASALASQISATSSELESSYSNAVSRAASNQGNTDAVSLAQANESAEAQLQNTSASISDLVDRITACESEIEEIKAKLEGLEDQISSLDGILDMIQSVTFVSEYSTEAAIAYYTLSTDSTNETYGLPARTPSETIKLNYLVRPASAAAALASDEIASTGALRVIGYYAARIQQASVSLNDFTIESVIAGNNGFLTVTVKNTLSDAFYYKEAGAKLALSITDGKNDLTTRFVEILPKDAGNTVYVESLTLSEEETELDNGETSKLKAVITPSDATETGLEWTSSNPDVVTAADDGTLTAVGVGEAVITVKTVGTDEWGLPLSASCKVKVVQAVRLSGPSYVETGGKAQMTLSYPASMSITSISWSSSNEAYATVDESGWVSGVAYRYDATANAYTSDVDITCTINGNISVSATLKVVALQPTAVKLEGLADDAGSMTMKYGETFTLVPSLYPDNVDKSQFRFVYGVSDHSVLSLNQNTYVLTAAKVGSADATVTVYSGQSYLGGCYWAPGRSLKRTVSVDVEPYYVETLSLPETFTMNPDQTATLSATFTSDVEGKQPTYTDLIWTSSDPSIISVNETTGEMTSLKEGTVTITAVTSNSLAVPEGAVQKSATCVVTVKTPVAAIAVGDYYYSDGTWSTELDGSKTVIGIVFATVNAVASDAKLRIDYPECSNGLVVSTKEYTSVYAADRGWSLADLGTWCDNNGYTSYYDLSNPVGYTNTMGFIAANAAGISSYGYTIDFTLFGASSPIVSHRETVPVPESASAWYIPSYKEMTTLYANIDIVNASISNLSGDTVGTGYYWTSTIDLANKTVRRFNMSTGNWSEFTGSESNEHPVRVVLAF